MCKAATLTIKEDDKRETNRYYLLVVDTNKDALLTLDKNENGQIDGIGEVFGSVNESGFDELRRVVDSNNSKMLPKHTEKLGNNFLKQNKSILITKQDNIYSYLKISNNINFNIKKAA